MKKVILDTSFILESVKCNVDFFENLEDEGLKILIPEQVIDELENVAGSKKKEKFRESSKLALKILGKNEFEKVDIGEGHVDKKIKGYAKNKSDVLVATMDKELKEKTPNKKVVIRNGSHIEII